MHQLEPYVGEYIEIREEMNALPEQDKNFLPGKAVYHSDSEEKADRIRVSPL